MMPFPKKYFFAIPIIYFLFALIGLYNASLRPALPMAMETTTQGVKLTLAQNNPQAVKWLSRLEGYPVYNVRQVQEIIERKPVGASVLLTFNDLSSRKVVLVPHYTFWQLSINLFLGFIFFAIGLLVWHNRQQTADRLFSYSAFLTGFIIIMNWGGLQLPLAFSLPLLFLYFLSYPLGFLTFWAFSYYFPYRSISTRESKFLTRLIPFVSLFFSFLLVAFFLRKTFRFSLSTINAYYLIYRLFRLFILFVLLLTLFQMIRRLLRLRNPEHRLKLQWVLWGVFWGSFPFVFLWNVPQIFGHPPFIPEWIANVAILFIPISIAIAILRHRLFDIEIVISRSLVYFIVALSLIVIYLLSASALSLILINQFSLRSPIASVTAALLIALLFNPLKTQVQQQVDRRFYRIKYDRFQVLKALIGKLENLVPQERVLQALEEAFQRAIPVKAQMTFCIPQNNGAKPLGAEAHLPTDFLDWFKVQSETIRGQVFVHAAKSQKVENGNEWPKAPLPSPYIIFIALDAHCAWLIGEKRSEQRFWKEEVDLARQMATAAAAQLEKIHYMENYLRETLEKEKAQQLSDWKSLLVAEVAHDLRAPLNTILWKLRNLSNALETGKAGLHQSTQDIQKQVERLQHLIHSLLAFAAIEKGELRLQTSALPVKVLVHETLDILQEPISQKNLVIHQELPESLAIRGDPILVQEILLNLLSNAIKFSAQGKTIRISASKITTDNAPFIEFRIGDQAGGMTAEQIAAAFEPFRQGQTPRPGSGFHLGLFIVKQFTELLKGKIKITSQPGQGTDVLLLLPAV